MSVWNSIGTQPVRASNFDHPECDEATSGAEEIVIDVATFGDMTRLAAWSEEDSSGLDVRLLLDRDQVATLIDHLITARNRTKGQ